MIEGIVAAIVAAVATIIGATVNAASVKKTNETNRQLQQEQLQTQHQQWLETNEYNTPAAQVKRYIDAGLNPNLVTGVSSNAQSQTLPTMPKMEAPQWGSAFQAATTGLENYRDMVAQKQQIDESQAKIDYYRSQASLNSSKEAFNVLRNTSYQNGGYFDTFLKQQRANLRRTLLGNSISNLNRQFLENTLDDREKAVSLANDFTIAKTESERENKKYLKARRFMTNEQKWLYWAKRLNMDWQTSFLKDSYYTRLRQINNNANLFPYTTGLYNAQTDYYTQRGKYTKRKFHFIPLELGVDAAGAAAKFIK